MQVYLCMQVDCVSVSSFSLIQKKKSWSSYTVIINLTANIYLYTTFYDLFGGGSGLIEAT